MTNRRSKEDMIRLELAQLLMEALFSETTLFLEGDGPLIFAAFDKVMSIFSFIENTQLPNVDAVIESIVSNHPHPAVETLRLKTQTVSVVQPGFHYFTQKFHAVNGEFVHQMKVLKLARFCNSVR